jgi:hypothetical protein
VLRLKICCDKISINSAKKANTKVMSAAQICFKCNDSLLSGKLAQNFELHIISIANDS